jgi:TctA family transporter
MDSLYQLANGFGLALGIWNLLFALIGCLLGTLIGVLPGIAPLATLSILLPITVHLSPLTSLIMLSGIYYGAQYGGSTTSILCNLPGEATSVVTCIDGHRMAQNGRAGAALATAALSSLFAGFVGTVLIGLFGPALGAVAVNFNAPEYFALMLFGLMATVTFSGGSFLNALAMALIGVLFGLIGTDVETGASRYTLGISALRDGLGVVPVTIGVFGLAEIIANLSKGAERGTITNKVGRLWISRDEFRLAWPAAVRGTGVGALLGILPGGGVLLSTFAAYIVEQKVARNRSQLGAGAIEGVAAPEAANNAAAQTSFIPLLTLGIPANGVMALLLGAMLIQGIQPGPAVMAKQPELFWGLIASMFIGNVMLVIINLPLIGVWVQLLRVPYRVLFPVILVLCCIGTYTIANQTLDLLVMGFFVVVGLVLNALRLPAVPLLLGFLLGPLAEEYLRRALAISRGDPSVFLQRPISLIILLATLALMTAVILPSLRGRKDAIAANG